MGRPLHSCTIVVLLSIAALLLALRLPSTCASSTPSALPDLVVSNFYLNLTFSQTTFFITSFISNQHSPPYSFLAAPISTWWSTTLITNSSHFTLNSSFASPYASVRSSTGTNYVEMLYGAIPLPHQLGTVDIAVWATLPEDSPLVKMGFLVLGVNSTQQVGMWDWTWSVGPLRSTSSNSTAEEEDYDDVFILNNSYGALYRHPLTSAPSRIDETYPSGGATYQFLAHYHELNATAFPPTHPGLYFATHDPTASVKTFSYIPDASSSSITLSVTVRPPFQLTPSFPYGSPSLDLSLGVFSGDWWDASQLYRESFALQAPWTRRSIRERTSGIRQPNDWPQWVTDTHLWLNTGWQEHDVFDPTQGDPAVVVERMTNFVKRFALPNNTIALHWYVFQKSNKFDAFYPVYFPAKDNFTEGVAAVQSMGVSVFPYINGRIFDIKLPKWTDDNAQQFAAKSSPPQLTLNLSLYREDYGNNELQAAMCPATAYWQNIYADVADTLVHTHGVKGIYVDQVGAASAQPCFDVSHRHTLGDGTAWITGYTQFFQGVRARAGNDVGLVTESNAEPYMQLLNGYLTLTTFQHPVVGQSAVLVPVFPAVYGGYFMGFGAIFTVADMENADGGFATLLGAQFVHGAQLGWMSLGGTTDAPPMGLYELLMAKEHDAEVEWMRRLALMRGRVVDWFTYGREMRTPPFQASSSSSPSTSDAAPRQCNLTHLSEHFGRPGPSICSSSNSPPPPYLTSSWLLPGNRTSSASLLLLVVIPSSILNQTMSLPPVNVTAFGFSARESMGQFSVEEWRWDGTTANAGVYDGGSVQWKGVVAARSGVALVVTPVKTVDEADAVSVQRAVME